MRRVVTMPLFTVSDLQVPAPEPRRRTRARRNQGRATMGPGGDVPVKVQRVASLLAGELRKGQCVHLVSAGEWSNFDLIEHLLSYFDSPPGLWLATWSSSDSGVRPLARLRAEGRINHLACLMDPHAAVQRSDGASYLRSAADAFGLAPCHAKVYALLNDSMGITVVTSANVSQNPRIECGTITHSLDVARFHRDWISAAIREGGLFATQNR